MDWAVVAALGTLGGFGIAFATFWMRWGGRVAAAEADAKAAREEAKAASQQTTLLATSFSLYREQVAREYIHREVMREVEDRLTAAIERLGDRLDRFVEAAAHKA